MTTDDLVARAKERADAPRGTSEDWGYRLALEENDHFAGRWRGETTDPDNNDQNGNPRRIFLLWDDNNTRCYSRSYAALNREIDEATPWIGCSIVIARGKDYQTQNGTGYSFGVTVGPNANPVPGEGSGLSDNDDDIPF